MDDGWMVGWVGGSKDNEWMDGWWVDGQMVDGWWMGG